MLDRKKVENLIENFLRVANHKTIGKIESKVIEAFFGDGTGKEAVHKQLLGWVETNPGGRHKKAIPAARALYEYLFGGIEMTIAETSDKNDAYSENRWPLVNLAKKSEVGQKSNFVSCANSLTVAILKSSFEDTMRHAPSRHKASLKYFVGHSGIPSGASGSNRVEPHLAIALFNLFKGKYEFSTKSTGSISLLDYEFPLKSQDADHGVGKVDLLGISTNRLLNIIELKIEKPTSSETPLRALLQALAYSSIVMANIEDIRAEILADFGLRIQTEQASIAVMATDDYWNCWFTEERRFPWQDAILSLAERIENTLPLTVSFLSIKNHEIEMGGDGKAPQFKSTPLIVSVLHKKTL